MLKFNSQYYKGIALGTAVFNKGVIVADETTGKLYVHDGVTVGGNLINALAYTPLNKAGDTMTGLFAETVANAITAGTTLTQAGATALTAQINTVTTSTAHAAPQFDGVKLPASAAGLEIEIINTSANPIQVYGSGSDTVDGVAATTGIIQPPNSMVEYTCSATGSWYSEGLGVGYYTPSTNTVAASLFTESTTDNITAHSGGGQASATQLFSQTNRVLTVAALGDSVKLPPSAAGLELVVINGGANAMQVYGFGTDTVDGVAAATGVSQMKGSMTIYSCPIAGAWVTNGLGTGYAGSLQTLSYVDGLTATGTTQGTALGLTAAINKFSTVTGGAYGAVLPTAAPGLTIIISNSGASTLTVFGAGSDTINTVASTTGVTMMSNSVVIFTSTATGAWIANGLGAGYSTSGAFSTQSAATSITGLTGGQGSAALLTAMINAVTTNPASGGVRLPINNVGMAITVANNGANSLNVFADSGSTMNGTLNGSSALAINTVGIYYCIAANTWVSK